MNRHHERYDKKWDSVQEYMEEFELLCQIGAAAHTLGELLHEGLHHGGLGEELHVESTYGKGRSREKLLGEVWSLTGTMSLDLVRMKEELVARGLREMKQ